MIETVYRCSECWFVTKDEKEALSHVCPALQAVTITTTVAMTAGQKEVVMSEKNMESVSAKMAEFLSSEYNVNTSATSRVIEEVVNG
jgi:hypothetical protein